MIDFSKEYIKKLEQKTGLSYLENPGKGSVCYADQNTEMRDEFKQFFTPAELQSFGKSIVSVSETHWPLPKNDLAFWKLVRLGLKMGENPKRYKAEIKELIEE